jgi:VanZ family protein
VGFSRISLLVWFPVIVWMGVIFFFSTDLGGGEHTSRFIGPLIRWLKPDISSDNFEGAQFALRKLAHVIEYAILAMLILRALRQTVPNAGFFTPKEVLLVLTLITLYAITDEIHQSFVSTRIGTPVDVLIDTVGGAIGLMVVYCCRRRSNILAE